MRIRLIIVIVLVINVLRTFATEVVPFHIVEGGETLSGIADLFLCNYGKKSGCSNKQQYIDSLFIWNRENNNWKTKNTIRIGQIVYLMNPQTFQVREEIVEEVSEIVQDTGKSNTEVSSGCKMSKDSVAEEPYNINTEQVGDSDGTGHTSTHSYSWVWFMLGLLVGLALGAVLLYVLFVKKLEAKHKSNENELSQTNSFISKEKAKVSKELSELRSKMSILSKENERLSKENKRLFEENIALGEKMERLKGSQSRTYENKSSQTNDVFTSQVSSPTAGTSSTLYADAIIDDYFVKVRNVPNEDSLFVLHLNGENLADFVIYQPAYQRVIANPSFLTGCEKQILGDIMQLEILSEGKAQREVSTGKWKVVNKLNVIIK